MPKRKLKDAPISGALEQRRLPDGRRRITLTQDERALMSRQQMAEAAAALFLDLETDRSWKAVAEELGVSPSQLRDLTKTPEFDEAYNALFAELGHDPRFRAAQAALGDMLPLAIRELRELLVRADTPAGVRHKVIQDILKLNGLGEPTQQQSDRQELARFLVEHRIELTAVQAAIPPEYIDHYRQLNEAEIVEGEVVREANKNAAEAGGAG